MTHAPSIVVVGSINMDLVTTTATFPSPGETLLGHGFSTRPGGKGANQAIAAARAGGRVALLGAVGTDGFGAGLRRSLTDEGVGDTCLRTVDGPSGTASITVDDAGENSIVVVPAANSRFTGLTEADLEALRGADVMLCQLEIPMETVVQAARAAHDRGATVMLNPSPVRALPDALVENVDVLVANRHEAALADERIPHLITTLGADGARYAGASGGFSVAAPRVQAVDSTGAGDAFAGAFAVAWAGGADPSTALRRGTAAGALTATRRGAGAAAPTQAEIDALVPAR